MVAHPVTGSAVRLAQAGRLLSGEVELHGVWPRCCAWLLRLALEHAVHELWARGPAQIGRCRMRTQLIALRKYAADDTAHATAELWYALSRVAHHQDYELSPAAVELRNWYGSAERVCTDLAATRIR